MQFTPVQLKDKLLGALDEDNNVIDTAVVLEVITILEKFPITREALEKTRIGRHVNELRKKTNNEELAKRAKKLVREWQKFLKIQDSTNVNGDSVTTPPQHRSVSVLQKSGNGSRPSSPAISSPVINRNCVSQVKSSLSPVISHRAATPSQQRTASLPNKHGSRIGAGDSIKSKLSPGLPRNSSLTNLKHAVNSPKLSNSPNLQTSRLSPAVPQSFTPQNSETSVKNVKLNSPKVRSGNACQSPHLQTPGRPPTPSGNEDSLSSYPDTLSSVHSSQSPEPGNGHVQSKKNKGRRSKSDKQSNHSTQSLISQSDIGSRAELTNVSKADIANRKRRAGFDNSSATPVKQQKPDSSLQSISSLPLNGKVYPKSGERTRHNTAINNSTSINSTPVSPECATPTNKKTLGRQDSSKQYPGAKTPKVKTTAELIAGLQQKTGSSSYGNDILEKLRTKQIEHEADVPASVLPPGVKPRKKRKSNDSSFLSVPSSSLSQTKTELVEKFLQTSVSPTSTDLSPPCEDISIKSESTIYSSQSVDSLKDTRFKSESFHQSVFERKTNLNGQISNIKTETVTPKGNEPSTEKEKRLTIDEIYSQLPPINYDNINWEGFDYEISETEPVTDSVVNRISNEAWPGINGCSDRSGVWHDWASTVTLPSADDDPLHILPYVLVDD